VFESWFMLFSAMSSEKIPPLKLCRYLSYITFLPARLWIHNGEKYIYIWISMVDSLIMQRDRSKFRKKENTKSQLWITLAFPDRFCVLFLPEFRSIALHDEWVDHWYSYINILFPIMNSEPGWQESNVRQIPA
jgi:hypothetical protein